MFTRQLQHLKNSLQNSSYNALCTCKLSYYGKIMQHVTSYFLIFEVLNTLSFSTVNTVTTLNHFLLPLSVPETYKTLALCKEKNPATFCLLTKEKESYEIQKHFGNVYSSVRLPELKNKEYFWYNLLSPQKAVIAVLRHSQIFKSFTYGEQLCIKMSHLKRSEKQQLLKTMQPVLNLHKPREHLHLLETCSGNSSPQPLHSRSKRLER